MELNISQDMKQLLTAFLLVILPLILLFGGALAGIKNAGYFITTIVWFALGLIFFYAIE
jgi:hypothetical protein